MIQYEIFKRPNDGSATAHSRGTELWGIRENGVDAVPFCHLTPMDAIEEFMYFENLNLEREPHRKFLSVNRTREELDKIEAHLIELANASNDKIEL
jgi:hypothetical protein